MKVNGNLDATSRNLYLEFVIHFGKIAEAYKEFREVVKKKEVDEESFTIMMSIKDEKNIIIN